MRRVLLIALAAAGLSGAAAQAKTNYMCVQNCLQHSQLYQTCMARCSDGMPEPQPPALPPAPAAAGAPPAASPGTASVPASAAPPGGATTPLAAGPAPPAAQAVPGDHVDMRCFYLCADRGRLAQYCAPACTH